MAKLHEKRNFVQFSAAQVQNRYVNVCVSEVFYCSHMPLQPIHYYYIHY